MLDQCIQLRFLNGTTFGMRRILPFEYHGVRVFQPENACERTVVDRLAQKGYEVALYLAGRNVLAITDGPALLDPRRSRIQDPAFITPVHRDEFPEPDTLLADGRSALIAFQKSDGYDIEKSGWTVAMRPLRARNETCVQCHTTGLGSEGYLAAADSGLKAGDPLGVALYVYRRR